MIDNQYIIKQCNALVERGYAKSLAFIAVKCGQSKQYFSDLKKNKARFSLSFLDSLEQNFPIIRREYALNGDGNPFKDDYETIQNEEKNGIFIPMEVLNIIISQQRTIENLSIQIKKMGVPQAGNVSCADAV